jgi:serine/threonine-protein kinase SRPK3
MGLSGSAGSCRSTDDDDDDDDTSCSSFSSSVPSGSSSSCDDASSCTDDDDEVDEGTKDYRPGGYHPVEVGDSFCGGRYHVIRKLGWGQFSTVWLARDDSVQRGGSGREVAIKVTKGSRREAKSSRCEIAMLEEMRRLDPGDSMCCVRLLDSFEHQGPNGLHVCMVLEPLAEDLLSLADDEDLAPGGRLPLPLVRRIVRQLLVGLAFVHGECRLVHTDLKLENVMLAAGRGAAKIVDFGNACRLDDCLVGDDVQTRQYRSPEVLLRGSWSSPVDLWSVACMVFEMVTGDFLFDPHGGEGHDRDEDHLAMMMELLGRMPVRLALAGERSERFFDRRGRLKRVRLPRELPVRRLHQVLREKYGLAESDATELEAFLLPMLHFDPEERATAVQMLDHPWIRTEEP